MNIGEFWDAMLSDATPGEKARFARLVLRLLFVAFMFWSLGTFGFIGFYGFARAGETEQKIEQAVTPLKTDLAAIKRQLDDSERIQRKILAQQLSAQLRDLNRLRCSTGDAILRARVELDMEEAQQEYVHLTGDRYPVAACKDL